MHKCQNWNFLACDPDLYEENQKNTRNLCFVDKKTELDRFAFTNHALVAFFESVKILIFFGGFISSAKHIK